MEAFQDVIWKVEHNGIHYHVQLLQYGWTLLSIVYLTVYTYLVHVIVSSNEKKTQLNQYDAFHGQLLLHGSKSGVLSQYDVYKCICFVFVEYQWKRITEPTDLVATAAEVPL